MPSGSSVERALICTGSVSLPQANNINEFADEGTSCHTFIDTCLDAKINDPEGLQEARLKALAALPEEHREAASDIAIDRIEPLTGHMGETAFVYDVISGNVRFLGQRIGRNYGELAPTEIPFSADAIGHSDDKVWVVDWKTGYRKVTPAAKNWQLRLAALAVAKYYGKDQALVAVVYTRGKVWYDWAEKPFDAMDLEGFAQELKDAYVKWTSETPRFTTGSHCSYCAALTSCPAMAGLVQKVLNGDAANGDLDPVSAYELMRSMQAAIKNVEGFVRTIALREPIELKNGKHFGMSPKGRVEEFRK